MHRPSYSATSIERSISGFSLSSNTPSLTEPSAKSKRFDEFQTIDWLEDAAKERLLHAPAHPSSPLRSGTAAGTAARLLHRTLEGSLTWFVFLIVGSAIGLNAALMSIITVWLSDLKLGYCTQGWWLNRKFCCWEMEDLCADWQPWTAFPVVQWLFYVAVACLLGTVCAYIVRFYAPLAAGSGISEIKSMLSGFKFVRFVSWPTLVIKSLALPIAIASGLSVGKEGPSVHVAAATGYVIANWFGSFRRSESRMREVLTAASAAGVAAAFGSPIGGVLFALEEMTVMFPIRTMWRSFMAALMATFVLSAVNPFRTGKLVLFQVHFDRDWHFFELGFFVLIGVFGGLYGAFVIKYNLQFQAFRRKRLAAYPITETFCLTLLTGSVAFTNMFLKIDMNESLEILFRECEGGGDYENLCQSWAQWRMVNSLLLATVIRTFLIILTYGCKVPAGIFVPSMAVGATFGRLVGICVKALYNAYPSSALFATCSPDIPCITPGTYAFLGAAAGLAGITRMTVTVVVIMFELTGALSYILPTMIVVLVTKAVSDQFKKGGMADQTIGFAGLPALEKESEVDYPIAVVHVTKTDDDVKALSRDGLTLELLHQALESEFNGFPLIDSPDSRVLLGYLSRKSIERAVQAASQRQLPASTRCGFRVGEGEEFAFDMEGYVNWTPLTVTPSTSLDFVMQLFKRVGPRLVILQHEGKLAGLATLKDCLKATHTLEHIYEEEHGPVANIHDIDDAEIVEQTLLEVKLWCGELYDGFWRTVIGRPNDEDESLMAAEDYELDERA